MKLFEYMRKENLNRLPPEQQRFMAKLITREVEQIAREKNMPVEKAYYLFSKGLFGSDREV